MTFTTERTSLENMLESCKHNFTVKDKDDFILYSNSNNGIPCSFLTEDMGEYSDKLLLEFLCRMDDIYKYIFSSSDEYLNRVICLMIMFIDINYDDLKNGGFSYCSHVNGYFSFFRERKKAEMLFENEYQKNKSSIIHCFKDYERHKSQNSKIYRLFKENIESVSQKADIGLKNGMIHFIQAEKEKQISIQVNFIIFCLLKQILLKSWKRTICSEKDDS